MRFANSLTLSPCLAQSAFDSVWDRINHMLRETHWTGWVVLLGGIFAGIALGKLVQTGLRVLGQRLESRGWHARGEIFRSGAGPAALTLFTVGLSLGLAKVALGPNLLAFVTRTLALLYIVALGWFLYNLVAVLDIGLRKLTARTRSSLDDQIVPLIRKTLRIFLVIVFVLFTAENVFGADITAWLTGLGIAGLAVSLSAQDSLKNLFGSVTIILDRPFAVGELITFAGHTGTVEEIGFRSTRLRTLAGNLVSVPNSKIVDSDVENLARRPAIRRVLNVTVTYDTTPEKVEEAVAIIKRVLAEPQIVSAFDMEKFPPRVSFDEFNADSLNIRVFYWFTPPDYWAYLEHAQQVNLRLLSEFADAGIEFAFPTRTLYLAGDANRELALRVLADGATDGAVGR